MMQKSPIEIAGFVCIAVALLTQSFAIVLLAIGIFGFVFFADYKTFMSVYKERIEALERTVDALTHDKVWRGK